MAEGNPYISALKNINLLGGLLSGEIKFQNGLNVICGENGTGKTELLKQIKPGEKEFVGEATGKIVIFNPKRNAEKQNLEHFANKLRTQGLDSKKLNETLARQTINDSSWVAYPSLSELFMVSYEGLTKKDDGSISIKDSVEKVKCDFNLILKRVFPAYEILAEWKGGELSLQIKKNGNITVPLEKLSCGESEAFSLIFNIYANRESQDIYIIDEPEIHLNWSLEEGLFNFLDWFCNENKKQIIIATHSRVIFEEKFLKKAQFFVWKDGKVLIQESISEEIREKIAGDAVKIVTSLSLHGKTFFVEDDAHEKVIIELGKILGKDIGSIKLGNSSAVASFCKAAQKERISNAYFMVDGDNQNPPGELAAVLGYVHLKKYCIQNYFLNPSILALVAVPVLTEQQVQEKIKECILTSNSDSKFLVFKRLAENIALIPEDVLDTYDASRIIESLAGKVGLTDFSTLAEKFIQKAKEKNELENIFGEITSKIN